MTYRVWYRDGSARLVTADTESEAEVTARELAELDAADLNVAFKKAKRSDPDRAREIAQEYAGCTKPVKVEQLT